MKLLRITMLICVFHSLFIVARTEAQLKKEDFLIDPLKPFVYLEVSHLGPRKPLDDSEPNSGIWLGLVNNCRLPIVVIASQKSDERTGEPLWVADEVVPNRPPTGTESSVEAVGYQPGEAKLTDIFIWPNTSEAEVIGAEEAVKLALQTSDRSARPHGYNDGHEPGAQILRIISPGQRILFSVPSDHVAKDWHLQIRLQLFSIFNMGSVVRAMVRKKMQGERSVKDLSGPYKNTMAERGGFEPPVPVLASTTV
jgi:hypothetical protein